MKVSSQTALRHELKPLEAPFLPTDDPWFLWLKHQILIYFEDWLKTIKARPEVYKKSEKQKMFIHKSVKGVKINVHTVTEQAYKVFNYE